MFLTMNPILTDQQKQRAIILAHRLHAEQSDSAEDVAREMTMRYAELCVIMHGAGILRAVGGTSEADVIDGASE
jgi:short-subunit dehydrogenase involved in D-alanine esterification of teichoic acids